LGPAGGESVAVRMDRMYRHQRHLYDATRKFYLLGRDRLVRDLDLQPGERACEVGCGTGRNLIALARTYPATELYGLDASQAMLATASRKAAAAGLADRIRLRHGAAETLDRSLFGLDRPFDVIFFSYSLSMIPGRYAALDQAFAALAPRGRLAVVDFGDFGGLPGPCRAGLRWWLARFGVNPDPAMPDEIAGLARRRNAIAEILRPFRSYAVYVTVRRR